ncbi:MAG: polyprenyl synthetase family protein [Nitrososphaeria archaeon]
MNSNSNKISGKLASKAIGILAKKGEASYAKAREIISNICISCESLRNAINYFFIAAKREIKHPGLLSIACEAVGGSPKSVIDFGAAIYLILAGVHIHDDIIDGTQYKNGRLTVYGKFGRNIALLTGDAFLFEGLIFLFKVCQTFQGDKKERILEIVRTSFLEIGDGEAYEANLRRKKCWSPDSRMEYLKMRAAVAEAIMKIGGIIGNGEDKVIENLGHYGRTLGFLSAIRDEFIDVYELKELNGKLTYRNIPLPILFVLQDSRQEKVLKLLQKKKLTKSDVNTLVKLVMETPAIHKLKKMMRQLIEAELQLIKVTNIVKSTKRNLELLLLSTMEDL